jgi:hypothetical protein
MWLSKLGVEENRCEREKELERGIIHHFAEVSAPFDKAALPLWTREIGQAKSDD